MGKISKNDGFKTPDGYFEKLSEDMKEKLEAASTVIPKSDGFKVPEVYFDSLKHKILDKAEPSETKVIRALSL